MQEADLEAYEAMPIASFGEAMLRGMAGRRACLWAEMSQGVSILDPRPVLIAALKAWQM